MYFGHVVLLCMATAGCAIGDYGVTKVPDYDYLVGKKFSENIYGGEYFQSIADDGNIKVLVQRRPDGCATIFGVEKNTDIIRFWRVEPSPGQCLVLTKYMGN